MKRGFVSVLAAALAASALSLGGTATAHDRPAGTPVAQASADKPLGQKLAQRVLSKKKFARSVKAARQVLALSGVATVREGQEVVPATAPASAWKMTARETVLLARGADNRQVQLGTLAEKLGAAGVTIDGRSAAEVLPKLVTDWMSSADYKREEALSQPGIFAWSMQSARLGGRGAWDLWQNPGKMWLSSLEAIVVIANIERLIRPGAPPAEPVDDYDDYDDYEDYRTASAAADGGPCAAVSEKLKSYGPVREGVAQVVIAEATGSALQAYGEQIKKGGGAAIGKLLTGLDLADRILRTAAFAEHVEVEVEPVGKGVKDGRVHKPMGDRRELHFKGTVGLSKKARKDLKKQLDWAKDHKFQESIRNCATLHGIPIPRPYGDLAEDMEKWSAYWTLVRPSPEKVWWHHPRRTKLERVDFASTKTMFKISIPPETRKDHETLY